MALKHGTRRCYSVDGCRCSSCREAHRVYTNDLNRRKREGEFVALPFGGMPTPETREDAGPGSVELAVADEIAGLPKSVLEGRTGLAAAALAMGRVLDHPRVVTAKPSAARVLAQLLDALHQGAGGRRGRLALVKAMTTEHDGA